MEDPDGDVLFTSAPPGLLVDDGAVPECVRAPSVVENALHHRCWVQEPRLHVNPVTNFCVGCFATYTHRHVTEKVPGKRSIHSASIDAIFVNFQASAPL